MNKESKYIKINYIDGTSEGYRMINQLEGEYIFHHDTYLDFQYYETKNKIIEMIIPYANIKNILIEV